MRPCYVSLSSNDQHKPTRVPAGSSAVANSLYLKNNVSLKPKEVVGEQSRGPVQITPFWNNVTVVPGHNFLFLFWGQHRRLTTGQTVAIS